VLPVTPKYAPPVDPKTWTGALYATLKSAEPVVDVGAVVNVPEMISIGALIQLTIDSGTVNVAPFVNRP